MSIQLKGYTFKPRLIPTLLIFTLVPLLISLGLWQLDRAEEKRIIDNGVNQAIAKQALLLNEADIVTIENQRYRKALIKGKFDNTKQFLLDNRTHKGLPGYHVISPFLFTQTNVQTGKHYAVLINRGWIPYQGTRDKIKDISLVIQTNTIAGSIKNIPQSIVLKEQSLNTENSMSFKTNTKQLRGIHLIQAIQLDELQKLLGYELLPVMIELDKNHALGFVRDWQPYYGSIDKHNAYAVQWFAMAAVLLFLFFRLNIRTVKR